jgi:hypothetical protein
MEPEHVEGALDGFDIRFDEATGADLLEGEAECVEIGGEFGWILVEAVAAEDLGKLIGDDLDGEAFEHEPDQTAPRFGAVLFENGPSSGSKCGSESSLGFEQGSRRRLYPFREAEAFGEGIELPMQDYQRVGTEAFKRFCCDLRGDTGMPVPISAYPRAENELG